jgi:hypothetical protein
MTADELTDEQRAELEHWGSEMAARFERGIDATPGAAIPPLLELRRLRYQRRLINQAMAFRVFFSSDDRAWVATVDDEPSLCWTASSPVEALEGLMALTPVPSDESEFDETSQDDTDPRARHDQYVRALLLSGAARGCTCDKPGCHCDGIADTPEHTMCGCCLVDCPTVHGDTASPSHSARHNEPRPR